MSKARAASFNIHVIFFNLKTKLVVRKKTLQHLLKVYRAGSVGAEGSALPTPHIAPQSQWCHGGCACVRVCVCVSAQGKQSGGGFDSAISSCREIILDFSLKKRKNIRFFLKKKKNIRFFFHSKPAVLAQQLNQTSYLSLCMCVQLDKSGVGSSSKFNQVLQQHQQGVRYVAVDIVYVLTIHMAWPSFKSAY